MTRFWPRSLPGWILLIVVFALALGQGATLLSVTQEIARANRATDLFELGDRTMELARDLQDRPVAARQSFLDNIKGTTISGEFDAKPAIASVVAADDELAEMEDLLMARLATEGVLDVRIDRRAPPRSDTLPDAESTKADPAGAVAQRLSAVSTGLASSGRFIVAMQVADKSWFNFSVPMTPAPALLGRQGLPVYLAISAIVLALCFWAIVQLTAPYRRLERAVTRISGDLNSPPLSESGSREARATIRAVNIMQSKLREYVADREHLAAALAHDLRTPLTRMKLRCEMMRSAKDRQLLQSDIEELQSIVASVIDFASLSHGGEQATRVDAVSLLRTICDDFPNVTLAPETEAMHRVVIDAHPMQLGRCLRNLVENAARYADGGVISVEDRAHEIAVRIEDNGPGIPADKIAEVIKPFARLETSRNQAFGGTGLGLAIADTVARAHGGALRLENRTPCGLRAIITLPKNSLAGILPV